MIALFIKKIHLGPFAPILFVLLLLGTSVLYSPFRNLFIPWKSIEPAMYGSREWLLDRVKEESKGEGIGILLGSSRSAAFDMIDWENRSGLRFYNFSAPLATPSYAAYWLERLEREKIPVQQLVVEIDPILLTPQASAFPLDYGYDSFFVLHHGGLPSPFPSGRVLFSSSQVNRYLLQRIFPIYRTPPNLAILYGNLKTIEINGDGKIIKTNGLGFQQWLENVLRTEVNGHLRGSIPALPGVYPVAFDLDRDTDGTIERFGLDQFSPSPGQIESVRWILQYSATKRIPLIVFIPPVYPRLQSVLDRLQIEGKSFPAWLKDKIELENPGTHLVQPSINQSFNCHHYKDSMHIQESCFSHVSELLFSPPGN